MAAQQIPWGTITLYLDDETFRKAFAQGRSMYFDDSEFDQPQVTVRVNTLDAVRSVLDEYGKGGYCFDWMAFNGPFGILGFFLGYMSGPILAESPEEYQARHSRIIVLPEEVPATRIVL